MIDINDKNFEAEVIKGSRKDKPVIVVFYAAWCPDSARMIERVIPRFEERYSDKIKFVKVLIEKDPDETKNPLTKAEYEIKKFPSLILFRKGRHSGLVVSEKDAVSQYVDMKKLVELALNRHLN